MIRGPFLPGRAAAAAQKPKLHVMETATTVVAAAAAIITRARVLMETDEEVMPAAHGKFWMERDRDRHSAWSQIVPEADLY